MELIGQLHLLRLGDPEAQRFEPITEAEWCHALDTTAGVRQITSGDLAPNLRTGGAVQLWKQGTRDAEVAVIGPGDEPTWIPVFSWQASGSVVINRVFDSSDATDPRTQALFTLAATLSASVVDDRGETLSPPEGWSPRPPSA